MIALMSSPESKDTEKIEWKQQMKTAWAEDMAKQVQEMFLPSVSLVQPEGVRRTAAGPIDFLMPFHGYVLNNWEEAEAGMPQEPQAEPEQSGQTGEEEELLTLQMLGEQTENPLPEQEDTQPPQLEMARQMLLENRLVMDRSFTPNEKQMVVNRELLGDYETLVQTFYTIDAGTMIGSDQLNVDSLSSKDMRITKEGEGPQILIYHTHSQEQFADSVEGDLSTYIVGVGEYLTEILTEEYGYRVLHHTGQYDAEDRDSAYSKALPAIEQVLEENPGIQVVIDLHRDAMAEETRLVTDLNGKPTARFMFFNGLSRTKTTGNISYLQNDNLEDNLAFSFQMQMKAAEYYPGLTRKIYLKGYRYNMHLRPKTLLIELGAQNNTVEEAMNACEPLAHILDMVLSGE